ncbi:MAG: hypothetical protein ACYTG2_01590 [Planctomycetota bacterium]|jgi:hypothetical protein
MTGIGLVDRLLAVAAMLTAIRPLLHGSVGPRSHVSWKRCLVLLAGGVSALLGVVGLLLVWALLLDRPLYAPSWFGGTLAVFGGMLGVATLIVRRGPDGLSEDAAIRYATQAVAMCLYLAAPRVALLGLGLTRALRAVLPWTVTEHRWVRLAEGVILIALILVARDATLGGLRFQVQGLVGP